MVIEYGYDTKSKDWAVFVKDEDGHIIDTGWAYDWDTVWWQINEFKAQYGDCKVIRAEDY